MGLPRGKLILIAIFVGVAAALAGVIAFTTSGTQNTAPKISISLQGVTINSINIDDPTLMSVKIDFTFLNESEQTFTLSTIDYDLFANEMFIGSGGASLEDIPLSGRAPLLPSSKTTLPSEMKFRQDPSNMEIWEKLRMNETADITWRAEGKAQMESAFNIIAKDFNSTL